MDGNSEVDAVLGHSDSTHGSQLRLRNLDDRIAYVHETSPPFQY